MMTHILCDAQHIPTHTNACNAIKHPLLHNHSGDASDGPVFHTRGLCLSEERTTLRTTLHRSILGTLRSASTEPVGPSETTVTAILLLAGLPRLLTGSILAHEVMHAFFRLAGYRDLPSEVEEGTCQLMALLWLEHQTPPEVVGTLKRYQC